MRIPKAVKVGGHVYRVRQGYHFRESDSLCGQADHQVQEIRISDRTQAGELRPRSTVEETFVHELLHCVDNVYNNHALSEEAITRLSQGVYAVLVDNKLLKE